MARRSRSSRRNEAAPGWVWMLFGLGLGLVVAVGVYLRTPAASAPASIGVAAPPPRAAPASAPNATTQPRPTAARDDRFDFYEILPQFEVVVPESDARDRSNARPPPAATPGSFLLQAGSFSAPADADRLQANLALLGFESHVQRVTIDDGVFNRVRIGPIDDLGAAERTQRQLRAKGIDTLLMRVPN